MSDHKESAPAPANQSSPRGRNYALLLLPVILIAAFAWWWSSINPRSATVTQPEIVNPADTLPPGRQYAKLAQSHYQVPDFTADIQASTAPRQTALNKARQALMDHRPEAALEFLAEVPAEYELDAEYLQAHAYFAVKNYSQSSVLFNRLMTNERYAEAAEWYSVLAMLPYVTHRKALVNNRLKKVAATDGNPYQATAKQLLAELIL